MKDLLIYVDQTEDSLERLRLGTDLAVRHDSYLTALYAREWSRAQLDGRKAAELGLVSAHDLSTLDKDIEAAIAATADRMRAILDESARAHGLRSELLVVDGAATTVTPQYARYADLCILGRDVPDGRASVNYTFSEQLLFVTGRPVIFVPGHRAFGSLGRHIAVAWNSSRPAARSLNDALPLIERADKTTVMMINPSDFIGAHEAPPGEQMIDHLAAARREGRGGSGRRCSARRHCRTSAARAQMLGADLLVAGAFGYPRLWEKMLGGVTHDLIANMVLPICMSH